jgi:hypothetical protein
MIPIALALAMSLGWAIAPVAIANLPPSPLAQATPSKPVEIRSYRLGLNGLRLGDSPQRVRARLGRPQRTQNQPPGNYDRYESWYYPNLTLGFGDGLLAMIATTRPNWGTTEGVRVGDRSSRILAVYGEPTQRYSDQWEYRTEDGAFLTLRLRGDRIVEIVCGWLRD